MMLSDLRRWAWKATAVAFLLFYVVGLAEASTRHLFRLSFILSPGSATTAWGLMVSAALCLGAAVVLYWKGRRRP